MIENHLHGPRARRPGPDNGTLTDRYPTRAIESAIEPLLVVVEVIGVVVHAGPPLDLTDAQHLPGAHRDGLAGDRLDDQLLANCAVGRSVHLDEARWTRSERGSSGEQKASMFDDSTLEDIAAALAEHARFHDPIDECQMVGVDGEFHGLIPRLAGC